MDARTLSQFMLANATLVIDRQGQIRELAAGTAPAPGEVVVTVGDGANPQVTAEEVPGSEQGALNLNFDDEIAQIIAQLEEGADPTLNEDQATAAGGDAGSSLVDSGTVVMTLASVIAATAFSTEGFTRESLSQTQSLNEDLVVDEPLAIPTQSTPFVPLSEPADSETERTYAETNQPIVETIALDFELEDGEEEPVFDDNIGPFVVEGFGSLTYSDGEWTFEAVSAFNELNVGDQETGQFEVTDIDGGTHVVNVIITGTNDAPVFTGTIEPASFDVFGQDTQVSNSYSEANGYVFHYYENHGDSAIGQIAATDVDDEDSELLYSIVDGKGEEDIAYSLYFTIDNDGYIYLTDAGREAFTNDFESAQNLHQLQVKVTDPGGAVDIVTVSLQELEVDTPPEAESFTQTLTDSSEIAIVFNNDDSDDDHISDIEDDDPEGEPLGIVIGSLPNSGMLYYLDPEGGRREITQEDINTQTVFENNLITYEPTPVSESFELDYNLNSLVSAVHLTGNGSKPATVVWQYSNPSDYSGTGFGVSSSENSNGSGQGIGKSEILTIDLTQNMLSDVSFTLDGINPNHGASVTYTYLLNGEISTETIGYSGNSESTLGVTYSAPTGGAIVQIDFTTSTNGSNYTVNDLTGTGVPTVEDDSFIYKAIDSENQLSEDAESDDGFSTVTLDAYSEFDGYAMRVPDTVDYSVDAQQGADLMYGLDQQSNIFTWLDDALDQSTDIVKNFEFGNDKIDITDILEEDGNDDNNLQQLVDSIGVEIVENDVTFTVTHDGGEQSIIIEDGVDIFNITSAEDVTADLLSQILKTTDAA